MLFCFCDLGMTSFFKRSIAKINVNPFKKKTEAVKAVAETVAENTALKETLMKRFAEYLKTIYRDYKDVGVSTVKATNENPFKALGYGLFMTTMVVWYKKNPTMNEYVDKRKELANDLLMCGSTYSKRSQFYLKELNRLESLNQLEFKSFVIFSLVLVKKFSEHDANYEKRCKQLHAPNKYNVFNMPNTALKFISRIVDIGFVNEWYYLNKNMENYDVDETEWMNNTKKN